ncbi:toprim domain-containing protein [Neomoorella thermoacetica]|uniref:toprim domain-containing protein n=1 Tax=Neomoorella thermoacetica TaxID=1525 RepID=UPI001E5140CD|nr:toprim domain-containing protein [Moorella thermoacetica]
MRVSEGAIKHITLSNGQVAHLHRLQPGRVIPGQNREDIFSREAPLASIDTRDRVYRNFLRLLDLYPRHRQDLLRRGLSEFEIKRNGYKSVPDHVPPWTICRKLSRSGLDLTGIPGFYRARSRYGGSYWTFNSSPAYFIPVLDAKGHIQALQRRMDDIKNGKYMLFSGHSDRGGCSCGTPAHVARPIEVKDSRIWITEGQLKADIAAVYLGAVVIGAQGAASWKPVVPEVLELGAAEVVIAYDRDQEINEAVARGKIALKKELKKLGILTREAVWQARSKKEKGIDDALVTGLEVKVI